MATTRSPDDGTFEFYTREFDRLIENARYVIGDKELWERIWREIERKERDGRDRS